MIVKKVGGSVLSHIKFNCHLLLVECRMELEARASTPKDPLIRKRSDVNPTDLATRSQERVRRNGVICHLTTDSGQEHFGKYSGKAQSGP